MTDVRLSEWDGTPWAGDAIKAVVPYTTATVTAPLKAVTDLGPYANSIPLSMWSQDPTDRAAAYLRAYKVGWFYKAESKISLDIATLKRTLAPEDAAGDNETDVLEADLSTPWDALDPPHQFLRLMERPNPSQTGRQLFQKTQIRADMAGWTYWYLENAGPEGSGQLPTAIYGISPTRLTPSFDGNGVLIGWVLDRNRGGGVPFEAHEIVQFSQETAEDGSYGQGVVEAILAELPLGNQFAQHQSDLLSTGGRLAGMLWPKDRTLLEAEFEDAKRAWRSVASDPNAARRLLLFPEPMEYATGAADPSKIGIPDLATLNRDNILTAFPISPYMLGVPQPGGLNSGETRREDRKDYWEGTIHPRVELLEEVIQSKIVPLYEAVMGTTYDFDIEEPNLDDASSLIEKVAAFDAMISAGFNPDDVIAALGLDGLQWTKPAPTPVAVPVVTTSDTSAQNGSRVTEPLTTPPAAPPSAKSVATERDAAVAPAITRARDRLERFFADQRQRVTGKMRAQLPAGKAARMKAAPTWWDPEEEDSELTGVMREIYADVGRAGLQSVADTLGRVILKGATQSVIADLLTVGGERIKDINARTLQALTVELAEGTRRGYSINQLIEGVPEENYRGVLGAGLDNGTQAWSELRAETIARTETMLSYNRSTVTGYGEFGVTTLLAYDGDGDEECAGRDGQEFSIDEAQAIDDHPNGTLVWSPVVEKSADHGYELALKAIEAYANQPAAAPPVVNVTVTNPATDVHVEPQITVEAQEPATITVQAVDFKPLADALAASAPTVNVTTPDVRVEVPVTVEPPDLSGIADAIKGNVPVTNVFVEPSAAPDIHLDPVINVAAAEPPIVNVTVPESTVQVNLPAKTTKRIIRDKTDRIVGMEED